MATATSIRRWSGLGLAAGGGVLGGLLFLPYETVKALGDSLHHAGNMKGLTPELFAHARANLAAISALVALASLAARIFVQDVARFFSQLGADRVKLRNDLAISLRLRFGQREIALWLGAIMLAGLALRLNALFLPLKNDEAVSYASIAGRSLRLVLFNDWSMYHAFNNLMIWFATRLGGDAEWVIRFPVFAAGMAVIALTYWFGAGRFSPLAGLAGAATMAVAWPMVEYSTDARGYMLGTLFLLISAHLFDYARLRDNRAAWLGGSLAAAMSAYCVSTMVIALFAMILWLLGTTIVERRMGWAVLLSRGALAAVVSILATLCLYITFWIGSSPLALTRPPAYAMPQPGASFLPAWTDVAHSALDLAGVLLPQPLALALPALAILGACRNVSGGCLALSMPVAIASFLLATGYATPPARTLVPLLPFLAVLAGHGLDGVMRSLPSRVRFLPIIPAMACLMVAAVAASRPPSQLLEKLGAFPEAPGVSRVLLDRLGPGEAAIGEGVGSHLVYYMARQGRQLGRLLREGTMPGTELGMVQDCLDPACATLPTGYITVPLRDDSQAPSLPPGVAVRATIPLSRLIDLSKELRP